MIKSLSIVFLVFITLGCSFQRIAVSMLADTLSGTTDSGNVFMRDNDPELIGDALPFTIKFYEMILDMQPNHRELLLTTGSLYVMYANAFVWAPAELYSYDKFEEQLTARRRAINFYLRGRDYILLALDEKYPGFAEAARTRTHDPFLLRFDKTDVPYLYWLGAGWFGAFSLDVFNVELSIGAKVAADVIHRAYELDPDFDNRAIDEFYISFHPVAPDIFGGDPGKTDYHFQRVVELRGESTIGPYLAYIENVIIPKQDFSLFREFIQIIQEIPINDYPDFLLINTIHKRKADWMWKNREDLFLEFD